MFYNILYFCYYFCMNINKWIKQNTYDLNNKTAVITGATGGLGKQLCKYLCSLNCNLILACRNKEKTNNFISELKAEFPNVKIDFLQLNLEDINSVKNAVDVLKNIKFNYLIHNSGVYNIERKTTSIGIDNIFQVNFVAPYFITKELLPNIEQNNTKVIAVGSIAHNYSKIDKNDIEFKTKNKSSKIYGNSKRYLMFSLYELFKSINYSNFCITHPGVTLTNMTNHYHWSINWLVKIGIKLFFPSVKKATLHLLSAVFENCDYLEWIGPTIFNVYGKPKKSKLTTCDNNERQFIFKTAEEYYKRIQNIN